MDSQEQKKKESPIQRNIRILAEEAKKNENRVIQEDRLSVKDLVDLQQYQVKVQNTLMWLSAIDKKLNPPMIQKVMGPSLNGMIPR